MKISALQFMSNIAVGDLTNEACFRSFIKSKAQAIKKRYQLINSKKHSFRYFLHSSAEHYGFKNWTEVDQIAFSKTESVDLDELRCRETNTTQTNSYYYFVSLTPENKIYFFSIWSGWSDDGYELRGADPVKVDVVFKIFREQHSQNVVVLDHFSQLLKWRYKWRGNALLNEELVLKYWPELLAPRVVRNFPKAKAYEFTLAQHN